MAPVPPAPVSAAAGRPRRRWLRATIGGLALLLGALWLARGPLLGPTVARVLSTVLARETGGQAHIARAAGGWLGDARLSGVQVSSLGPEPWWRIAAQQVAVHYDLGLLHGELSAVRGVTIEGVQVDLDLDRQPAVPHKPQRPWPGVIERLPASLPALAIAGDVRLVSGGHQVQLNGMQLAGGGDHVTLSVEHVVVDDRKWTAPTVTLVRTAPEAFSLEHPAMVSLPGLVPASQEMWCDRLTIELGGASQRAVAQGRLGGGTWQARATSGSVSLSVQGIDLVALGKAPAALGRLLVDAEVERHDAGWMVRSVRVVTTGLRCTAQATVLSEPWRCTDLLAEAMVDLAQLPGARAEGTLHATLRGEAALSATPWVGSRLTLKASGDGVVWRGRPCAPLALGVSLAAGDIDLTALDVGWNTLRATLAAPDGAPAEAAATPEPPKNPGAAGWRLKPRPIALAGGIVTVSARGGAGPELDGDVTLGSLPLAELAFLTRLRHVQGSVGGHLHLGGTLVEPQWTGALSLTGLEVKLSPDIPTLTAGSAQCTLAARVVNLIHAQGDLGGAMLSAQGRILLDGGEEALALSCHGRNLLLVQRHDARVRADLDLRLGGSFAAPLLRGEVAVTSALLTPELHLGGGAAADVPLPVELDERTVLFELPDPPLSTLRFDLKLSTAGGGSKNSDAGDSGLRVVTRWGRGLCDLDLHLGGTGAAPEPDGRVTVREGVATLPFSTLAITHGELLFPPGDPFQPRITATATARIRRYDVQVQVTGTLHDPKVRASGSGLDEQEALLLLTTGSTPRELQAESGQLAALGRLGSWLGQETWRSIEGADDPEAGPSLTDRVSVEWGRESSTQGRDTIDAEVELTTPGLSPALLMTGERDRYEQYNGGFTLRWYWGGEDP